MSCTDLFAVSIPVPLESIGRTEVGEDEGGCYILLAQSDGCTQRNNYQLSFWEYLLSKISWKPARLGPSKVIASGLQGV